MSMPTHTAPEPLPSQARPYRVVAELREVQDAAGRIWQYVSTSAELVDHAWLQRDRLYQLSEGAVRLDVCWETPDGKHVVTSHRPPAL